MIWEKRATKETIGHLKYSPDNINYWADQLGGFVAYSGVEVTEETAIQLITVWACVRVIAETIGTLPLKVYKELAGGGKTVATNHFLYKLLHGQPNPEMTSVEWLEMVGMHTALRGNHYSQIVHDGSGKARQLWPLNPATMTVKREGGLLRYYYVNQQGKERIFPADQILHVREMSNDGLVGLSPVGQCREGLGIAKATEKHAGTVFSKGARFSGLLKFPGKFKTIQAKEAVEKAFADKYAGTDHVGEIPVMEQGMEFVPISMSNEDAQFLESRKFQVAEIARIFRVPLFMIQETEKSTSWGTGIEQMSIGFAVYTIRPRCTRIETAIARDLKPGDGYKVEFLMDALLRGDAKSRAESLQIQFQNAALTPNEWRAVENRNPDDSPNADKLFSMLNVMPIDSAGEVPKSTDTFPEEKSGEEYEKRAWVGRSRVRDAHRAIFRDGFDRIVKREVNDIRKRIEKQGVDGLRAFLDEFYESLDSPIRNIMRPAAMTFARSMNLLVGQEVGSPEWDDRMTKAVEDYLGTLSATYRARSRTQLNSVMEQSETPVEAIEDRLGEWDNGQRGGPTKAEKFTNREIVRAGEAFAVATYMMAGVRRKKWVSAGKSCPLCNEMDGRTAEIEGEYYGKGETLEAEGVNPLTFKRTIRTPPLHGGCDCYLAAEF